MHCNLPKNLDPVDLPLFTIAEEEEIVLECLKSGSKDITKLALLLDSDPSTKTRHEDLFP